MPELPEVETVIRSLFLIKGKKIKSVEVFKEKLIKGNICKESFAYFLSGKTVNDIKRKGKYIFFLLEDLVLINHLRMTGKYIFEDYFNPIYHQNSLCLIFNFEDNTKIFFCDSRNFATFHLQNISIYQSLYPYNKIGLDLVNDEINIDHVFNSFKNKKIPIKASILEQSVISGIGNIYASEILFAIKIHPLSITNLLSFNQIESLINKSIEILIQSIELKGTSISDYVSPENKKGSFQNQLKVYGRTGKSCFNCLAKIVKINVDNRSTFFCPVCQKI